jgi:chaperonin cofactor prefoldin
MSEDTAKDLEGKYSTKPTIETVLERFSSMEQAINTSIDGLETSLNARLDGVETSLKSQIKELETSFNIRLDRIESEVKLVHSQTFSLRADLTELRHQLNLPA